MSKRIHIPKAKPGELRAVWGRPDPGEPPCVCYAWGGQGADKSDSRLLMEAIEGLAVIDGHPLAKELEARGYDLTTLRFSIRMKEAD